MSRRETHPKSLPPCYAMVFPGLEPLAEDEIVHDLGGEVKKSGDGLVVFRVSEIDASVLQLRTTEDVFLLAWGTDQLSYRATDLERIRSWTAKNADWNRLLRIHHAIRPKPKGKPTFRLVAQMEGEHGYFRRDARKALTEGLAGKLPPSWRHVEENAAVEIWLTIHGARAVCGLRLSDRTMRHRTYKMEHLPASLRPTMAAALARLAEFKPHQTVLDPMCGAGTILAEVHELARHSRLSLGTVIGGDVQASALGAAGSNLRRLGKTLLVRWDATHLPLANESVDRIVCNPPFGKQLSRPEDIRALYRRFVEECGRVLRPQGRSVLLVSDWKALTQAMRSGDWKELRHLRVGVLGQAAFLSLWSKN